MNALVSFVDEQGVAFPSVRKLASVCRTSPGAVRRALAAIETGKGPVVLTIERSRQAGHGDPDSHRYTLSLRGWDHTSPTPDQQAPTRDQGSPGVGSLVTGGGITQTPGGGITGAPEEDSKKKTLKKDTEEERNSVFAVFEYWRSTLWARFHDRAPKLTNERRSKIQARLSDGYSVDDLKRAIDAVAQSPHHMGKNDEGKPWIEIELIFRKPEKVDGWLSKKLAPVSKTNGRRFEVQSGTTAEQMAEKRRLVREARGQA